MNFEKLKVDEIECRVNTVKENGCSILLYKTARVDAKLLDETVGAMNWKNDFRIIDGVLYGCISIWDADKEEWVEKLDAGAETYTEKEKGRASDAFKRAGFKWGIGRELYSSPFVWINKGDLNNHYEYKPDKWTTSDRFKVTSIAYDEDRIVELVIYNTSTNKKVYELYKPTVPKMTTINAQIKTLKLTEENIDEIKTKYDVKELKEMTDEQKIELGEYLAQRIQDIKKEEE